MLRRPIKMHRRANESRPLVALAAAMLTGLLLSAGHTGPAFAADDDDDTFDTKFVKGLLSGLGLRQGNEPGIDYHERSPLVVPPTRDLPPPDTGTAAAAARDPAWPKDPDVAKRKKVKKEVRNTVAAEEEDMRQLRPDELNKKRAAASRGTTASAAETGTAPEQLSPWQLGFSGFKWSNPFNREGTVIPFVAEPPRTSLTEPPPGLRTPSPKYQYGSKGTLEPVRGGSGSIGTDQAVGSESN